MDPDKAWREIAEAIGDDDWVRAAELADGLILWLDRDGYAPKVTGQIIFDRMVVHATCDRIAAWECA